MPTLTVIIGSTRPGRAGLPIAEWFIDRARQHGGFTPLHEAAQNGNGLLVDVLLAYGATLDATTDDGKSAWALATEAGQTDVADLLANFGATA